MVSTIKPIETVFNGYRFRSRLEARWAVFFYELTVPYTYESEGFDLGNGMRYLPDFYFPVWRGWAEIKGQAATLTEIEKAARLAVSHPQEWVALIQGSPWPGEFTVLYWGGNGKWRGDVTTFAVCDACQRMVLSPVCDVCHGPAVADHPLLLETYAAARQARFEYGERGGER